MPRPFHCGQLFAGECVLRFSEHFAGVGGMFKERDQLFVRFRIAEYPIQRYQIGIEVVIDFHLAWFFGEQNRSAPAKWLDIGLEAVTFDYVQNPSRLIRLSAVSSYQILPDRYC